MNHLSPNEIGMIVFIHSLIAIGLYKSMKFQYKTENLLVITLLNFLTPALFFLLLFDIHPLLGLWTPGACYLTIAVTMWFKITLHPSMVREVLGQPMKFRGLVNRWDWTSATVTTIFTLSLFTMGLYVTYAPK